MRWLGWILIAIFATFAAHAAFVLAVPTFTLGRDIAQFGAKPGSNTFFILPGADQARLFPTLPASGVTGVCAFDLSQGQVDFSGDLPDEYWTLTIYSSRGDVIYAVNNEQSGEGPFTVNLKEAPSLIQLVLQTGGEEVADTGRSVESGSTTGLIVLWMPLAEPTMRQAVIKRFERSSCRAVPKTSQAL